MKKFKLFQISSKISPYILIGLILITFPLIGSECNTLINGNDVSLKELLNTWLLQRQSGIYIDVCPEEQVTFFNSFTATIICPNKDTVVKTFSLNNSDKTITYTQTGVIYKYEVITSNNVTYLNLYGVNVNRNLYYIKLIVSEGDYKSRIVKSSVDNPNEIGR